MDCLVTLGSDVEVPKVALPLNDVYLEDFLIYEYTPGPYFHDLEVWLGEDEPEFQDVPLKYIDQAKFLEIHVTGVRERIEREWEDSWDWVKNPPKVSYPARYQRLLEGRLI
jgi:hypothetical protein